MKAERKEIGDKRKGRKAAYVATTNLNVIFQIFATLALLPIT
jgi:hypothetical protein